MAYTSFQEWLGYGCRAIWGSVGTFKVEPGPALRLPRDWRIRFGLHPAVSELPADHALTRVSRLIEIDSWSDFSSIARAGVAATQHALSACALSEPTPFPASCGDVPAHQGLDRYRLISGRT